MDRESVPPASCYFFYPHPVTVVGVLDPGRQSVNFAPVVWASPMSSDPPLFGVCLSPRTYSYELALKSGEFTLNFLDSSHMALVQCLGKTSGRQVDKVQSLGLPVTPPEILHTPSLAMAYAAAECQLRDRHPMGDQVLLVGEVHHLQVLPGAFDADGVLRLERVSPLLYLGSGRYVTTERRTCTGAAVNTGSD